jgi:hypothetical protein
MMMIIFTELNFALFMKNLVVIFLCGLLAYKKANL